MIDVASRDTANLVGKTIKDYVFAVGNENGTNNGFATLPFKFGSTWKTSTDSLVQPFVGIGTALAASGKCIDLTGATAVKFKIRSHVGPLSVRFKIQTFDIDQFSEIYPDSLNGDEFGYYGKPVSVTQAWSEKIVAIEDLKLPGTWARDVPFNIKSVTKLVWEIQKDANSAAAEDTLDIDDIMIIDFTKPSVFPTKGLLPLPTSGEFASFEKRVPNVTPLSTYWNIQSDRLLGGTSDIIKGATEDSETNFFLIDMIERSGSDSIGRGLVVTYELGKSFVLDSTETQGFIGMGCNLYDSLASTYWNAKDAGAKSIYFHYITFGDSSKATLEIGDTNDVSDALNLTRKSLRGPGVVWHRDLPATGGVWRAVEIPFDSLVCDNNLDGSPNIPLDRTKLSKIQWKVKGSEGQSGTFAIDNVYFPGVIDNVCPCIPAAVKHTLHSAQHSSFNAQYLNGFVHVNFHNKTSFTTGKISLFKAQGSVISTISLTNTDTITADLPAKNLPSGVYFVKINGVDANGKAVVLQAPVSIVR